MIPIDKGVPLLPSRWAQRGGSKYPWHDMEVGDSFFAAGEKAEAFGGRVSNARRSTGFRFTTRTVTENGVTGVRVWRVS